MHLLKAWLHLLDVAASLLLHARVEKQPLT